MSSGQLFSTASCSGIETFGSLDGSRFASSSLNDLYRRVIIRNNRLKRLLEIYSEVILEKDVAGKQLIRYCLTPRKSNAVKAEGGRALKSLVIS
ncbi:MAG: hypothetical protein R2769_02430 [Saprospiraceae bacterium]